MISGTSDNRNAPENSMGRQPQETRFWSPNHQHHHEAQKQLPISNTPPPEHWCTIAYYELDQQVCCLDSCCFMLWRKLCNVCNPSLSKLDDK